MRVNIPKMISGILATFSIVVVGYFLLRPIWFWVCWEIFAAGLVAVGCAGEWYLFKNPAKRGHAPEHKRSELKFVTAVALGVSMELVALAHAIPESIKLEREVEELREANLLLRSNVVALEIKAKPRRIAPDDKAKFVTFLSNYPKGPVKVYIGRQDDELLDFTRHIRDVLDAAGYGTTNQPGIIPLGENSGYYTPIGEEAVTRVSVFIMFYATNNQIVWPGIEFLPGVEGVGITKVREDDPRAIPVFISQALKEIGVTTGYVATQQLLGPGEWGVFVRQKF